MDESREVAEVLAGMVDLEDSGPEALREAIWEDIHLRKLRRQCGCESCRAYLGES